MNSVSQFLLAIFVPYQLHCNNSWDPLWEAWRKCKPYLSSSHSPPPASIALWSVQNGNSESSSCCLWPLHIIFNWSYLDCFFGVSQTSSWNHHFLILYHLQAIWKLGYLFTLWMWSTWQLSKTAASRCSYSIATFTWSPSLLTTTPFLPPLYQKLRLH